MLTRENCELSLTDTDGQAIAIIESNHIKAINGLVNFPMTSIQQNNAPRNSNFLVFRSLQPDNDGQWWWFETNENESPIDIDESEFLSDLSYPQTQPVSHEIYCYTGDMRNYNVASQPYVLPTEVIEHPSLNSLKRPDAIEMQDGLSLNYVDPTISFGTLLPQIQLEVRKNEGEFDSTNWPGFDGLKPMDDPSIFVNPADQAINPETYQLFGFHATQGNWHLNGFHNGLDLNSSTVKCPHIATLMDWDSDSITLGVNDKTIVLRHMHPNSSHSIGDVINKGEQLGTCDNWFHIEMFDGVTEPNPAYAPGYYDPIYSLDPNYYE